MTKSEYSKLKKKNQHLIYHQSINCIAHDLCTDNYSLIDQHIEHYFKNKKNDSTTVGITTIVNKKYIVKRYNNKNIQKICKRLVTISKAKKALKNADILTNAQIPTTQPIAIIENKIGPLNISSCIIYKYQPGVDGEDYFGDDKQPNKSWPILLAKIAELLHKLGAYNIYHGDLSPKNILINNDEIYIIDLDALKQCKKKSRRFQRLHKKDIKHFLDFYNFHPWAKNHLATILSEKPPSILA